MRALQFMFFRSALSLKEIAVPKFSQKVLEGINVESKYIVKVHYSPINPSDLGFISGVYGRLQTGKFPMTAGFEGSGIIVDSDTQNGKKNIGKKVSFFTNYENS